MKKIGKICVCSLISIYISMNRLTSDKEIEFVIILPQRKFKVKIVLPVNYIKDLRKK